VEVQKGSAREEVIVMTALQTPAPSRVPDREVVRRRTRRVWAAGLVAVLGLLAAGAWAIGGVVAAMDAPDDFARAAVPGEVTVEVTGTGTQYIYYEGAADAPVPTLQDLDLRVTGPRGDVPVEDYGFEMEYDAYDGFVGTAVATFEADVEGVYTVAGTTNEPGAALAVGGNPAAGLVLSLVGSAAVVVLTAAVAVGLVISASSRGGTLSAR
jgi:hypothetical protein